MRYFPAIAAAFALAPAAPVLAQTDADAPVPPSSPEDDGRFTLGQIVVTGQPSEDVLIGDESLSEEAMRAFNRNSLDDAVNLIPGVVAANSGGSRNERLIFVRGFDRFQIPLSIDGIRVYLPADNRLDFGRFLTADIAEVQVAKGYASVLDGPGAMGGAINLVTRKPTEKWEGEARAVLELDNDGDYAGYTAFGLVGTRRDSWYAQASFARSYRDHWDLADDFTPTLNEDGGERDFSETGDWRLNVKAGYTPGGDDEYAISYTRQEGEKEAPLHITSTNNKVLRNWTWPEWNIESLYFLSTTRLDDVATLKTRLFKSNYYNMLRSYDDRTLSSQTLGRAFDSPYDDEAVGGSAELSLRPSAAERFSLAFHYRRDEHEEKQLSRPDLATATWEPTQQSVEKTYSIAAENRLDLAGGFAFTLGASYDWRDLVKAEEYDSAIGIYEFPKKDAQGWNAQGRIDWTGADGSTVHAFISSRVRFPTLFERFSSQFGTAEPNPGLKPERATNLEIGGATRLGPVKLFGSLYYSFLDDALVTIRTTGTPTLNRRENIGSADYYGGEIGLDVQITPHLGVGVNYSYIHRSFDVGDPPSGAFIREFRLTDVPSHKGFAWLSWEPLAGLTILPSVEFASDRTTIEAATVSDDAPVYYDLDGYVLASLRVDYAFSEHVSIGAGARNLFDEDYALTDGYPEAGRSLFLTGRITM